MKKISLVKGAILTSLILLPLSLYADNLTSADATAGLTGLSGIVDTFTNTVVKSLATMFLSLALLAFFYGIVEYVWGMREGKPDMITKGNTFLKWSLVGLFVMFSIYGIIQFGQGILFNGKDITNITIPNIKFNTGTGSTQGATNGGNVGSLTGGTNAGNASTLTGASTLNGGGGAGVVTGGGAPKLANYVGCSSNSQCASNLCQGNNAASKQCVPNTTTSGNNASNNSTLNGGNNASSGGTGIGVNGVCTGVKGVRGPCAAGLTCEGEDTQPGVCTASNSSTLTGCASLGYSNCSSDGTCEWSGTQLNGSCVDKTTTSGGSSGGFTGVNGCQGLNSTDACVTQDSGLDGTCYEDVPNSEIVCIAN